jgi:hypothetical protein
MRLTQSATELTTAATDALLGGVCLSLGRGLLATRTADAWKRRVWAAVLALLGVASVLGAAAHGFDLAENLRAAMWYPLYLSLGVAVAFFVVAALCDWRGESAARPLLPWAAAVGCSFFALTQILGGSFAIFIGYEALALTAALAVYAGLAVAGKLAGAALIAIGIALSMVAAAVQASGLSVRVLVPFDHNGIFHLVQLAAVVVMAEGVRRGLNT